MKNPKDRIQKPSHPDKDTRDRFHIYGEDKETGEKHRLKTVKGLEHVREEVDRLNDLNDGIHYSEQKADHQANRMF